VQADLLQVNSYNVQNNRLDLTKDERKKISSKQMKVAEDFRKVARKIAVDGAQAEKSASKDIKSESNKKYKADEIMDELPDSASSALF
jgi:ribosome recycling factor